ncbi:MAG TPA: toll/interleukin-1 receptor domain-containing protein [Propionicimonas sp.]|nr:toll/interleukin-1 receptor domain-containing protein [Propionicimonas sp.]
MKVFISWSGGASRELALSLRDWLPKVIQGVVPFVSAKDIDKGSNWTVELARELADSDFGIVCLTPDNLLSPWLNYEAGAITASVSSRICPVLLGVEKSGVKPPLSQLQLTSVTLDDFILLANSVNKAAGSPLDLAHVDEAVRVWWPRLEEKISAIDLPPPNTPETAQVEPPKPQNSIDEMLKEILTRLRAIEPTHDDRRRSQLLMFPNDADTLAKIADLGGLNLLSIAPEKTRVRMRFSKLPSPIPEPSYVGFSEWANQNHLDVVLDSADRFVVFDRDGSVSEPPV